MHFVGVTQVGPNEEKVEEKSLLPKFFWRQR